MSRVESSQRRCYRDLREYLEALEAAGRLTRITEPINKDTELHPLVRLQFRGLPEEARRGFLFENVFDGAGRHYDVPVAIGVMAGSRDIYATGLCCAPDRIAARWTEALGSPVEPVEVGEAPVQEVVYAGSRAAEGMARLPVPISTPGFDNAPYTTASHWVTRDPVTGIYNLGTYRGMLQAPTRIGCLCGTPNKGLRRHLNRWRDQGADRMPAAVVIGAPPHIAYTSVIGLPYDTSEFAVAGGLAGAPVEMVRCRTIDLLVPAQAEIVIEGELSTRELEMEGPFGEWTGYMARRDYSYFLDVSCVTMRARPVYLAFLSQFPPSESSTIRREGSRGAILGFLQQQGHTNVLDVHQPDGSGCHAITFIRIRRERPDDGVRILETLAGSRVMESCKVTAVFDEDIDVQDPEAVYWALAWCVQAHRDIQVRDAAVTALDPSIFDPRVGRNNVVGDMERTTALFVDATRKWPYPPVSLPEKGFMEHALELWERLGLPPLRLRSPWFGYSLGYWSEEDEREAGLAVAGRYFESGEAHRASRRPIGAGEA